jgi:hypothetical protein
MSTTSYDDVLLNKLYSAEELQTALLVPGPETDPQAITAREQPTLMLANPSSLALSLMAIATFAGMRIIARASDARAARGQTGADRLVQPRRKAA